MPAALAPRPAQGPLDSDPSVVSLESSLPEDMSADAQPTADTSDTATDPNSDDSAADIQQPAKALIRTYVVEPGDSVRTIAAQFNVSNETLIWVNDLTDPDALRVGQKLQILPFSGLIHEVRPGDTIASIASVYNARTDDIIKANALKEPYIILVGQKIVVPGGRMPPPPKVTPLAPVAADAANAGSAAKPAAPSAAKSSGGQSVQAPAPAADQQAASAGAPKAMPQLGDTPQEHFIASIADAAVESQHETGVPASVTIAQAILESYWGSSRLTKDANNYFGIKAQTKPGPAGVVWLDVWEVVNGRNVVDSQPFRVYHNAAESFVDHGLFFVENGRYSAAMAARKDAAQFAREIAKAGYATDPSYAGKLLTFMDRYNLYRYDSL